MAAKAMMEARNLKGTRQPVILGAPPPYEGYSASNILFRGEAGCTASHIKAIIEGGRTSEDFLVMEDDIECVSPIDIREIIASLPDDWRLCFLGARPDSPCEATTGNIVRLGKSLCSFGYIVRAEFALELAMQYVDNLFQPHPKNCADATIGEGPGRYAVFPNPIRQAPGHSVIRGGHRDYCQAIDEAWEIYRPGGRDNFCLPADYAHQVEAGHFVDTPHIHDRYQRQVYEIAHAKWDKKGKVLDIGCGTAGKLVRHFPEQYRVGVEVEPTLGWLKANHPQSRWLPNLDEAKREQWDTVICSDVIEHIDDPASFLEEIACLEFRLLVISTPDRATLRRQMGPPENPCHWREWNKEEFTRFLSRRFGVLENISTREISYGGQVAICRKVR